MTLFSRSFWKDLFLTYIAETIVMACAFLCPGIVARLGGIDQLGIYLLLRRVASSLIAPLSLGLGVAVARFLPMCKEGLALRVRWSVFGISTASLFTAVLIAIMLATKDAVAKLLLGTSALANYVLPLSLLLLGNVVHALLYSHFRGMMQMRFANTLQALNLGIVPVVALAALRKLGLAATIQLTGVLMLGISAAFLISPLQALLRTRVPAKHTWISEASRAMVPYGLGRVPGFAFAGFLFVLGPIWLAHRGSMADVGMYALGLTFVRMAGAFFGPVGILVLPRLAGATAGRGFQTVGNDLQLLFRVTVLIGLFASLQAVVLERTLLLVWLGSAPESSRLFLIPLILVLPLYLIYEVLRNPIDAISEIPYNTIALGVSLLVLLMGLLHRSAGWLIGGQVASFAALGIISTAMLKHLYRIRIFQLLYWRWPLLFSVVSLPVTWLVQTRFQAHVVVIGTYEIILCALFLLIMMRTGNAPPFGIQQQEEVAVAAEEVTPV